MPPKSKGGGGGKAGGGGGGKAGAPYKSGPSRGNQKFEVPNKMKEKRGGGDDWRQWSRTPFQIAMTEGSAHDFHAKAFVPGTKGKAALNQMLITLHVANPAMEDIRQPLDNPYLETDYKTLAKEVAKYRAIAADRAQREEEALAKKERIHLDLRLLSGERRHGSSRAIAKSYEELQQAFLEVFPWHTGVVAAEHPNGSAVHPQQCSLAPGDVVCFRELAPPTDDFLTTALQATSAGWVKDTYRPQLLSLPTSLAAGDACEKPGHVHTHHFPMPHHHHHSHHHSHHSNHSHHSHHSSHHEGHHHHHHEGHHHHNHHHNHSEEQLGAQRGRHRHDSSSSVGSHGSSSRKPSKAHGNSDSHSVGSNSSRSHGRR